MSRRGIMDRPAFPAVVAQLEDHYAAFAREQGMRGIAWGLVGDSLTYLGAAGFHRFSQPAVARTFFRAASMTKVVTALAILKLRDAGAFALDTPAARILGGSFTIAQRPDAGRSITIRHLLHHTAGFVTDDAWADRLLGEDPASFRRRLAGGLVLAHEPGRTFDYSNLGYALLGEVIARVTGEPYPAWVRREVLVPLGMRRSGFDAAAYPPEEMALGGDAIGVPEPLQLPGAFDAAGGLITNAEEFCRLAARLLATGAPELTSTFAPPQLETRTTREGHVVPVAAAYGFGLVVSDDERLGRWFGHAGGLPGFGCHMFVCPARGFALVAFGNTTYAPLAEANLQAADLIAAHGLLQPDSPAPADALARAAAATFDALSDGHISPLQPMLAENVLVDRTASAWNSRLQSLRHRAGVPLSWKLAPQHARQGTLRIVCERAIVEAALVLTPEVRGRVQVLSLKLAPAQG